MVQSAENMEEVAMKINFIVVPCSKKEIMMGNSVRIYRIVLVQKVKFRACLSTPFVMSES